MATLNKLDQSNCQCQIRPAFAKRLEWSNPFLVSDTIDMTSIREALRQIMRRKDVKPTTLSLQVGTNRTLVKNLLETTNDVTVSTLRKLAGALDVDVAELLAAPRVPIVGYTGAGGEVIFEEFDTDETVIRPPGFAGRLEALEVRGSSMLPKYKDGDIIYIQRVHDGLLEEDVGDDCVVRLLTGETYIKQLIQGSKPGLYTLISLNAPPIENIEIEWATRVQFILPARSRAAME